MLKNLSKTNGEIDMDKQRFEFLLDELKLQVNFSIISINHFNETWKEKNERTNDREETITLTYEFWYYLQNYVISLANISKILYGVNNKYQSKEINQRRINERKLIRNILSIEKPSLLEDKQLRNRLEHIDEYIEKFSDSNPSIIANRNIGPTNMIGIKDKSLFDEDINNLRNFLTNKNELILFGKRINLNNTFFRSY